MANNSEKPFIRPSDLLKTIGIDYKGLDEEERAMQKLLIEEYRKKKKNLLDEIKKWRENHPESTFGEAIRALFELENKRE